MAKKSTIPVEKIESYTRLVQTIPGAELKGATMPYTSMNGHMYSFLDAEGVLGLRLGEKDRIKFMATYHTSLCTAHGIVLKEYVRVPEELWTKLAVLKKYFLLSFEYTKAMKPKVKK